MGVGPDPPPTDLELGWNAAWGRGLYAKRPFKVGERTLTFRGPRLRAGQVEDFSRAIQVGRDTFLGPSGELDDFVNHSCNPSCGLEQTASGLGLVAIRPIEVNGELTFDYSTCMDLEPWTFQCRCGLTICRRVVRPYRTLSEELRTRYEFLGIVPEYIVNRAKVGAVDEGTGRISSRNPQGEMGER